MWRQRLTQFVLLWWITDTTGPLGGTLADRLSRCTLLLVADSVTAFCTGLPVKARAGELRLGPSRGASARAESR